MCFTPKISLTTAMLEFLAAGFVFFKYQKSMVAQFLALFLFTLGFYQFTEFMMCTTGDGHTWGLLGFVTYTFLPVLGVHFALNLTKNKFNRFLLYLPVVIFVSIAFATPNFVMNFECGHLFVTNHTALSTLNNSVMSWVYWAYYFGYLAFIVLYLVWKIAKERSKRNMVLYIIVITSVLLTIAPPLLLIFIFPALAPEFPSIYCQFAFLFTIFVLIAAYVDDKMKSKPRKLLEKILKK